MTAEKMPTGIGWRVYGLGMMALGMLCLAWGNFDPGQPVPKDFPDRTALAYAVAAFMLVAGAAVEWRRTAAWGAAALAAYLRAHRRRPDERPRGCSPIMPSSARTAALAEQLAIAAGALIVYAANAEHRCGTGRAPHARGPTGVRRLRAAIRGSAFFLYEHDRPAGAQLAATDTGVLGLCNRHCPYRGGHCDPDGRAGPSRRDPADRHVCVLHPAGARADAPRRSL